MTVYKGSVEFKEWSSDSPIIDFNNFNPKGETLEFDCGLHYSNGIVWTFSAIAIRGKDNNFATGKIPPVEQLKGTTWYAPIIFNFNILLKGDSDFLWTNGFLICRISETKIAFDCYLDPCV